MNKNLELPQRFARTCKAAHYLDVSDDFLKQRMGKEFQEGTHYFKPANTRITRWDLEELEKWMKNSNKEHIVANNLLIQQFIA